MASGAVNPTSPSAKARITSSAGTGSPSPTNSRAADTAGLRVGRGRPRRHPSDPGQTKGYEIALDQLAQLAPAEGDGTDLAGHDHLVHQLAQESVADQFAPRRHVAVARMRGAEQRAGQPGELALKGETGERRQVHADDEALEVDPAQELAGSGRVGVRDRSSSSTSSARPSWRAEASTTARLCSSAITSRSSGRSSAGTPEGESLVAGTERGRSFLRRRTLLQPPPRRSAGSLRPRPYELGRQER